MCACKYARERALIRAVLMGRCGDLYWLLNPAFRDPHGGDDGGALRGRTANLPVYQYQNTGDGENFMTV